MSVQLAHPLEALDSERWDLVSRQVRANMGLGRDKFARLLQVTPRTVMRWENCAPSERVIPQGIQRMKLLALSLDPSAPDEQQDILNDLLEQATDLRAQYELKAVTIKTYSLPIDSSAPAWFDDLLKLKKESNWNALLLMGPHFLPREQGRPSNLPKRVEALAYLWIGIAAFMKGQPLKAIHFYNQALTIDGLPMLIQCALLANKGYALIRARRFEEAELCLDDCLRRDCEHRGALRNKLVLHSQTGDEAAATQAARALLAAYPDAGNPSTELGQCLASDPDLTSFRATESFKQIFADLVAA